ncbi:putative sodium/bile acid symporter family protein [Serratia symbiotica str. 'Cinara cedri']|nr:putative sodium/bile acid symporter family protein [Serratia symbiotica str. 'Cinara cedri']
MNFHNIKCKEIILMYWLQCLRFNKFLLSLILVAILASLFPCRGNWEILFIHLNTAAILIIFFMHGTTLSHEALLAGVSQWRMHLVVLFSTFILFPALGLVMSLLVPSVMPPMVYLGFLYLCVLPATVQSSIAFTAVAGGNIAASICSASMSSILGVFISPLLVELLIHAHGSNTYLWKAICAIILQLMVPFAVGYLTRQLVAEWVNRYRTLINNIDIMAVLLMVYSAFSAAIRGSIWYKINGWLLLTILMISILLLTLVVIINICVTRWLGFNVIDEITIVFCGSQKSLANGIPMAHLLFSSATVAGIVLPLIIFHYLQLITCALLAKRYAARIAKEHATIFDI